jgi:hypothetical protein
MFEAALEMVALADEDRDSPPVELGAHFKELFRVLNQNEVMFLVVGDFAVMRYTEPLYSNAIELWIGTGPENTERAYQSFVEFGVPLGDLTVGDLTQDRSVFRFGMAPLPVDVMTMIAAVTFEDAWKGRVETQMGGTVLAILSLQDLIRNKEAGGRDSDRIYVDRLRKYGKCP